MMHGLLRRAGQGGRTKVRSRGWATGATARNRTQPRAMAWVESHGTCVSQSLHESWNRTRFQTTSAGRKPRTGGLNVGPTHNECVQKFRGQGQSSVPGKAGDTHSEL